jgi:hypothetical protein
MRVYTLEDLKEIDLNYYNRIIESQRFNKEVKNIVRHPVVKKFEDFTKENQTLLLKMKKEIFDNNDIFVFGSQISGKYITKEEVKKYHKYPQAKESDWDIKSLYKPDREKLKLFETENNVKIDFQLGNSIIKI